MRPTKPLVDQVWPVGHHFLTLCSEPLIPRCGVWQAQWLVMITVFSKYN